MKYLIIIMMLFTACETEIIRTEVINPVEDLNLCDGIYCVDGKYSFYVDFYVDKYVVLNGSYSEEPPCGKWKNPFPEWGAGLNYDRDDGLILFPNSVIQMQVIDSRTIKIRNNHSLNGTAKRID